MRDVGIFSTIGFFIDSKYASKIRKENILLYKGPRFELAQCMLSMHETLGYTHSALYMLKVKQKLTVQWHFGSRTQFFP